MFDYSELWPLLSNKKWHAWQQQLQQVIATTSDPKYWGKNWLRWQNLIHNLPTLQPSKIALNQALIEIGDATDCNASQQQQLNEMLLQLRPWRKGPFSLFGIEIDAEWRSDWKWQRLQDHLPDLTNKRVLDVGANNGYFSLRMLGAGAELVIAIEPMLNYLMQWQTLQYYFRSKQTRKPYNVFMLPLRLAELPVSQRGFDIVFSMGVLYHQKSPFEHLFQLKNCLSKTGILILDTLIIPGKGNTVLTPIGNYAGMKNIWFLPCLDSLCQWLTRCGFGSIEVISDERTTIKEQRKTAWMPFQSLQDSLNPQQLDQTISGYPAPQRVILCVQKE